MGYVGVRELSWRWATGASESTKGKSGWKERGELKVLNRHESGMKVLKKW